MHQTSSHKKTVVTSKNGQTTALHLLFKR